MQESNFEKQVQQKLDELRLTPSEPVWQNIEVAIRKKKDRRLVFWILPVLLLAGGLVWWQTATGPSQKAVQQPAANNQTQQTFSKPHTGQQDQNTTTAGQPNSNSSNKPDINTGITTQETAQQQHIKITPSQKQATLVLPSAKKPKQVHGQVAGVSSETALQQLVVTKAVKRKPAAKNNPAVAAISKEATVPTGLASHATEQTRATNETNNSVIAKDSAQLQKATVPDSAAKPLPQLQKKTGTTKRLQWSIVGRMGASNAISSLAGGFGQKTGASNNLQADYSTWVPSSRASGYKQPAAPTPGVQYTFGALLKKGVGKKSFIQTGLQYSYYSYHLAVGTEPVENSLINRNRLAAQNTYLNNSKQNQFTNTLQFLELPLGFEYQLFKKIPLHVQHGVTISKLLSAKVLQYDYASNTYCQQSDGLRKTGIGFFTAVDYTIWKGKAASLQAGPHLQYGLQPLFKTKEQRHLLSGGLALTMSF